MANKYMAVDTTGFPKEVEGLVESAGAGDAGKILALDAAGKLANSVMPVGIGADTKILPSSENLAAGDFVNIWDDAGTLKVRKADASGGVAKKADGFVLAAVTSPANATVYFEGTNNQLTGLTIGVDYFLSAVTPGGVVATPPGTTNHIAQWLGKSTATTEIATELGEPITRA
jgi:hypothetical protein